MQYKTSAALLVAGLAAQQVVATWGDAGEYTCPSNTDNQCSDDQQGGYDWSGLDEGDFSSYGSNSFSGFKCGNSYGKRDGLTKRTFQSKCITGNLDDSPSMYSEGDDSWSIDEMQVSSSQPADVDAVYEMPDGSECTESHSCETGGSILKNSQCGGAKKVTFKPGANAPSGCEIGVHSVGFHCGPPSSSAPPVPSSSAAPSSPVSSVPASSSAVPSSSAPAPSCAYGEDCGSSSAPAPSSSAPAPSCAYGEDCGSSSAPAPSSSAPAPSSSAPAPSCAYGEDCGSSSSVPGPVSSSAVPSSSAPAPSCAYGEDCGSSSAPVSSSAVPSSSAPAPSCAYGEDCGSSSSVPVPVSSSAVPSSSAPAPSCAYGEDCASSSVPVPVSSSVPAPVSSSEAPPPSYPQPKCPDTLPKCLNTWMHVSECVDNMDSSCFCGNEKFIINVMECISAWSGNSEDTEAAASYLMGLCAPHVPKNPAIITACPSTVTPKPTPVVYTPPPAGTPPVETAPVTTAPPPAQSLPCTTITYSHSVVVPHTYSEGPSKGYTQPGKGYTTQLITTVTVPQVQLTTSVVTSYGTTTTSKGIHYGAPSVPAYPTPSAPAAPSSPVGGSAPPVYGGTASIGTSYVPGPTNTGPPIIPATGAGAKMGSSIAGLVLGALGALAAF